MWWMFFLSILAFSFWGETAEMTLDQFFGGLPVALYLKFCCLIGVCYLYLQMLREVGSYPLKRTPLDYVAPSAISLGLVSFVVFAFLRPIPIDDLRFIIIGTRDAVVLLFIGSAFLRGTLIMRLQEQVLAMRFKQAAIVLFFTCFAITTLGSISAAVMTILRIGDAKLASTVLQPFIYPSVFFFIVMLVPYRWYGGLLHLQRLFTYYRIKRIVRLVTQTTGTQPDLYTPRTVWNRPGELELAIYRAVIGILDSYPLLRDTQSAHSLFSEIHQLVSTNTDYADLVGALARLPYDRSHS